MTTVSHRNPEEAHPAYAAVPLVLMLLLWGGAGLWYGRGGGVWGPSLMAYLGLFAGVGVGPYLALPDRKKPHARKLMMLMLGGMLLAVAFLSRHGNMQIEGLFFALLTGGGGYILLHYALGKVFGPVLFGRMWCGWACWYAMIFELLPYPYTRFRVGGGLQWVRYIHLALSALLVAGLVFVFGYNDGAIGPAWPLWFGVGWAAYLLAGLGMAFYLKDNRAFCKYACPIAVLAKPAARYSLVKISGEPSRCGTCQACTELCPMNVRVRDYIAQGRRVTSSECTLCQTCMNVCPQNALTLSVGWDSGPNMELIDYQPPRKLRRAARLARRKRSS